MLVLRIAVLSACPQRECFAGAADYLAQRPVKSVFLSGCNSSRCSASLKMLVEVCDARHNGRVKKPHT